MGMPPWADVVKIKDALVKQKGTCAKRRKHVEEKLKVERVKQEAKVKVRVKAELLKENPRAKHVKGKERRSVVLVNTNDEC